jgi:hypothetical protein
MFDMTVNNPFISCRSLNWVTASHLECPFKETDPAVRDLIYTAINHVLEVIYRLKCYTNTPGIRLYTFIILL